MSRIASIRRYVSDSCVAYLAEYRRSIDMVRDLRGRNGDIPADVPPSLIHAVTDALKGS